MSVKLTLNERARRKLPRLVKSGRQWLQVLRRRGLPRTRVVFVVGSQRSGTRLPMQVMDYSPEIATFTEGASPFFDDVLLRPVDVVDELLSRSPAPIVALKPICETHRIIELLNRFPESRGIWIFRNYQDAVISASIKWGSGREAVRRLAHGELDRAGWRAGGLRKDKLDLVKRLYRDDMSLHEANAVMWYLRNSLFFDLRASEHPAVLLVRYEDLVTRPEDQFTRMFQFMSTPTPPGFAGAVAEPVARQRSFPAIDPEIRALCDELHERLVCHYASVSDLLAASASLDDRPVAAPNSQ